MELAVRSRLERCTSLPTLPGVALRIVQLCEKEDLDVAEIAAVINKDPALAAKLLRTVNSAAFRVRNEVRTVDQAVVLLGLNAVRALALSFTLVRDVGKRRGNALQWFWRRSLLTAVAGRELAMATRFPLPDEAFLGGLLSDLGVLALLQALGSPYEELLAVADGDHQALARLETERLGADHAEAGEWLLARWRLPSSLGRAVGLTHVISGGAPDGVDASVAALARLIAVAGATADIWLRADVADAAARAESSARTLLELEGEPFRGLLDRIAAASGELAAIFEVDLDPGQDAAAILERAKEALLALTLRSTQEVQQFDEKVQTLEARTRDLADRAQRDPLTGLPNRARLDAYLDEHFRAARSNGSALSVLMIDVDRFKAINDGHGHRAGDQVLRGLAAALGGGLRGRDLLGRWGGEEFMVVMPETDERGAHAAAERLRKKAEGLAHEVAPGRNLVATVSIGCATLGEDSFAAAADLVQAADQALYSAKHGGRNRVASWHAVSAAAVRV